MAKTPKAKETTTTTESGSTGHPPNVPVRTQSEV